jgi:Chromo (CHRromatin Organisation MOdifier) domain
MTSNDEQQICRRGIRSHDTRTAATATVSIPSNLIPAEYNRAGCQPTCDTDGYYLVEKLLARRKKTTKDGKVSFEYKVRWLGYDSRWDNWEPEENLNDYFKTIVRNRYILKEKSTTQQPKRNKEQYDAIIQHFQQTKDYAMTQQGKVEEALCFDIDINSNDDDDDNINKYDEEWLPGKKKKSIKRKKTCTKTSKRTTCTKNNKYNAADNNNSGLDGTSTSMEELTDTFNQIIREMNMTEDDFDSLLAQSIRPSEIFNNVIDINNNTDNTNDNLQVQMADAMISRSFIRQYSAMKHLRFEENSDDTDDDDDDDDDDDHDDNNDDNLSDVDVKYGNTRDDKCNFATIECKDVAAAIAVKKVSAVGIQPYQQDQTIIHENGIRHLTVVNHCPTVQKIVNKEISITSNTCQKTLSPPIIPTIDESLMVPLTNSTLFLSKLYVLICDEEEQQQQEDEYEENSVGTDIYSGPLISNSSSFSTTTTTTTTAIESSFATMPKEQAAVVVTPTKAKKIKKRPRGVPIPSFEIWKQYA